jgi:hypothetical protein
MRMARGRSRVWQHGTPVALAVVAGLLAAGLLGLAAGPCCPASSGQEPLSLTLADCCTPRTGGACSGEIRREGSPAPSLPAASSAAPAVLGQDLAAAVCLPLASPSAPASTPARLAGFPGFTRPLLV